MRRVLLTGARGPLAAALLDGIERRDDLTRCTEICAEIDTVVHCDAGVHRDPDATGARARVLDPLRTVLDFVERSPGVQLAYVSTAHVAGTRRGLFTEVDCDPPPGVRNPLEAAKYEAERRLRTSPARERTTVLRPSLCVDPGAGAGFGAFLRALAEGRIRRVCADPGARIDALPVDYVGDAVLALAGAPGAAGRTYHIVAGWERSLRVDALLAELAPSTRVWPAALAPLAGRGGRGHARYLLGSCVFDDFFARAQLALLGLEAPRPDTWLAKLHPPADSAGAAA